MGDIAKVARRILAGTRKGAVDEKTFPGYLPFDDRERPAWWSDDVAERDWGRVLGVHENELGQRLGAIVVTECGLAILEDEQVTWLPYQDIVGWDQLSKEPTSRTLVVRRESGPSVELKFHLGGAFAFVQFLISALKENSRGLSNDSS